MVSMLLLIIIYISFISLGLPDSLLGSAWPSMYADLDVPIAYAGILSIIISSCTIVSSILSSRIINKFGTGLVTFASVLMTAVALLGFYASGNFLVLCVFAVPLGLGAGSVDTSLNNFIALHYKAKHMSWLHCFWGVGATLGPIVMSYCLVKTGNWSTGYGVIGALQFLLVAILFISLPLWKKLGETTEEAHSIQQKTPTTKELLKLPGVKQALLSFFCYCSVETTTGLWGSSYLVIVKGVPVETAAKWIFIYFFGITFGRFVSGFLTMKFNNRIMIRLGQSLVAVGVILLLIPSGYTTMMSGFFLIGVGLAPIFPCLLHETPNNFGKEYSQSAIGLQMASAYTGSTLMPPLFGVIASKASYSLLPIFIGVFLLLMVIMVETLNKKVSKEKI